MKGEEKSRQREIFGHNLYPGLFHGLVVIILFELLVIFTALRGLCLRIPDFSSHRNQAFDFMSGLPIAHFRTEFTSGSISTQVYVRSLCFGYHFTFILNVELIATTKISRLMCLPFVRAGLRPFRKWDALVLRNGELPLIKQTALWKDGQFGQMQLSHQFERTDTLNQQTG